MIYFLISKGKKGSNLIRLLSFLPIIFLITLVSAETFGYNYLVDGENLNPAINYSNVNVNDSQFLRGYIPTDFYLVAGDTLEGDMDLNSQDLVRFDRLETSTSGDNIYNEIDCNDGILCRIVVSASILSVSTFTQEDDKFTMSGGEVTISDNLDVSGISSDEQINITGSNDLFFNNNFGELEGGRFSFGGWIPSFFNAMQSSHSNFDDSSTGYGFVQDSVGTILISSQTSTDMSFRVSNAEVFKIEGANSTIEFKQPLFTDSSLNIESDSTGIFFGLAGDVSSGFNASDSVENVEVGSVRKYFTNFVETIFDSNVEVSGNLSVTENLNVTGSPYFRLPMGEIYSENNAEVTPISVSGTFYPFNSSTNLFLEDSYLFNGTNDNRTLQYLGETRRMCHVAVTFSVSSVGANDNVQAYVSLNGVKATGSLVERKLSGSGDIGSTAIHTAPILEKYDNLTLEIANTIDTDDLTIKHMNMFATCYNPM